MATTAAPTATSPSSGRTAASVAGDNASKFLSFCLGKEEYGLEILAVREIIGIIDITPLPQTPKYVKGVINLRGKIIPVIELRTKFELESVQYTDETCVIVVEVTDNSSGEPFQMGVIVDNVREVLDISRSAIEPAPTFGCSIPLDYILGMGKVKEKVVILLNINRVVTSNELSRISDAVESSANAEAPRRMAA